MGGEHIHLSKAQVDTTSGGLRPRHGCVEQVSVVQEGMAWSVARGSVTLLQEGILIQTSSHPGPAPQCTTPAAYNQCACPALQDKVQNPLCQRKRFTQMPDPSHPTAYPSGLSSSQFPAVCNSLLHLLPDSGSSSESGSHPSSPGKPFPIHTEVSCLQVSYGMSGLSDYSRTTAYLAQGVGETEVQPLFCFLHYWP